jgi:hypothetical protein
MMRVLKSIVRAVLPAPAFQTLKAVQRRARFARASGHSDEEPRTAHYLAGLGDRVTEKYCVDIAAQDGVEGSQTLALFQQGWRGLAVEVDPRMFSILSSFYSRFEGANLLRARLSPDTVVSALRAAGCPKQFGFLSLDIDSFDYFLLEKILEAFRPSLMCIEINETIPPPLRFTVLYRTDHAWTGNQFQGQSLSQLEGLCQRHSYDLVELFYNNAFLIPREINPYPALTAEDAYNAGYRNKPDRRERFHWNKDLDPVLDMNPADARAFLRKYFSRYDGRYTLD